MNDFQSVSLSLQPYAWPLVVVSIVFWFREELSTLLKRLSKLTTTGAEFGAAPTLDQSDVESEKLTKITVTSASRGHVLPAQSLVVSQLEAELRRNLDAIREQDDQKVDVLLNELALSRILHHFYRVYLFIFGSQIELLGHINVKGAITVLKAHENFNLLKSSGRILSEEYSFDTWIGYLEEVWLIKREQSLLTITDLGREFLMFLPAHRLPESKAG